MSHDSKKAKVSIIIPYYSHGTYLAAAVQSARAAYSGPLEIIVVDDGSPEPQANQHLTYLKQLEPEIIIIRQANKGLAGARNAGLDVASGTFIQFLDSDDMLAPSKIDRQLQHFADVPGLDVSACDYLLWDVKTGDFRGDGDPIGRFPLTLHSFLFYWERGLSIPIHSGLFLRTSIGDIRFDQSLRAKEDWVFWCALVRNSARITYTPFTGALYRLHGQNMTRAGGGLGESYSAAVQKIAATLDDPKPFLRASEAWRRQAYV